MALAAADHIWGLTALWGVRQLWLLALLDLAMFTCVYGIRFWIPRLRRCPGSAFAHAGLMRLVLISIVTAAINSLAISVAPLSHSCWGG